MLIRNFLFRSSIDYYLPMRRTPHSILWHHLAARRYRKFRNHCNNTNNNNKSNNNNYNVYDSHNSRSISNAKDYEEYLSQNNHFYYFSSQQQQEQNIDVSELDRNRSLYVTIDIDVKRNGVNDQRDSSVATLTNETTKQNDKQYQQQQFDDLANNRSTTDTKSCLSTGQSSQSQAQRYSVLCRVVLATVGVGLLAVAVTLIWYYMGWIYGLPAFFVALLVVLLTKPGWRWFYIAGATAKRDLT